MPSPCSWSLGTRRAQPLLLPLLGDVAREGEGNHDAAALLAEQSLAVFRDLRIATG